MEQSKLVNTSFSVCDELVDDITALYEALADMEVEDVRVIIASIELKLNNIKLNLDEV